MSEPIVIDDGGSTRIKKLPAAAGGSLTELDGLLDVLIKGERAQSTAIARSSGDRGYGAIRIAFIDSQGQAFDLFEGPQAFRRFQIVSGNYSVTGVLNGGDVELTIDGPLESPPLVEAKQQIAAAQQQSGKRRYIVTNAPPITSVKIDDGDPFLAAEPGKGKGGAIYTSVTILESPEKPAS